MTEISFINYFGGLNDFENLKKWFKVNSDLYREVLQVAKERYELEHEYSAKLSKLSNRLIKAFQPSKGSICTLWTNTAHHMNKESDIHKQFGDQLHDDFYKPLSISSDQFIKFKKPVENEIDKCLKLLQDKREEETRLKKKAFLATKDCEKTFESIEDYKKSHPSSVSGNDKERTKIEKNSHKLKDLCTKAETEYFECSIAAEEIRNNWEQSYLLGLDQLQKFETDRLKSLKAVVESYHKFIDEVPGLYSNLASNIKSELQRANINDDLSENAMHYMNKSPNVYKTEQILLNLYCESKENPMDLNRRIENLEKRISALYQHQKKHDNLRTGALKLLTVYEDSSKFSDDATKKKTKREYCKTQSLVNFLSANIYKLLLALNSWQHKPAPSDPLISLGMKINNVVDRNALLSSILESKPGSSLSPCEPGILSRSYSMNSDKHSSGINTLDDDDDDDDFDADSDEEPPVTKRSAPLQSRPFSQTESFKRPLPAVPNYGNDINNQVRCKALHDFVGRDEQELSFREGDVIIIKKKMNDIWWEGEFNGKSGLIPRNYVIEF